MQGSETAEKEYIRVQIVVILAALDAIAVGVPYEIIFWQVFKDCLAAYEELIVNSSQESE